MGLTSSEMLWPRAEKTEDLFSVLDEVLSSLPRTQGSKTMAAMSSIVLTCSYAKAGMNSSDLCSKLVSIPSTLSSQVASAPRLPAIIKAQQTKVSVPKESEGDSSQGRRAAVLYVITSYNISYISVSMYLTCS